jgi:hypothetical protein
MVSRRWRFAFVNTCIIGERELAGRGHQPLAQFVEMATFKTMDMARPLPPTETYAVRRFLGLPTQQVSAEFLDRIHFANQPGLFGNSCASVSAECRVSEARRSLPRDSHASRRPVRRDALTSDEVAASMPCVVSMAAVVALHARPHT